MKKLVLGVLLVLLPIFLYYVVFLGFVAAVGVDKATPAAAGINAMQTYRDAPLPSVIIGDSKLAHLDMQRVEENAGRPFANLAYGGASLKENLDQVEWLLANYTGLEEIVFGLSFYTLNASYNQDRFETMEQSLYTPFAYLTNLSFNLQMLESLTIHLSGGVLGGGEAETRDPATYEYVEATNAAGNTVLVRQDILDYRDSITGYTRAWQPWLEQFDRLLEIIGECNTRGIRFVVVTPPMHDVILDEVRATGIEAQMLGLLARLDESPALVLDYELRERAGFADDQFYDGFHLDYARGLPAWTDMLFSTLA